MPVTAKLKNLRIAPRKVRLAAEMVRRKSAEEAQVILNFTTKKAAPVLLKLLKQAVTSAKTNFQIEEKNLYISKVLVDEGQKYKRWMPRARGMATPIYKRTSHITIVLDELLKKDRRSSAKRATRKQEKTEKIEKTEKTVSRSAEIVEKAPKAEKPKFKPEREERKPVMEKGIRRIFKRKAL